MSITPVKKRTQFALAAAAVCGAALQVAPTAQAAENCTVKGDLLHINMDGTRTTVFPQANGSSIGPGVGTASGGINPTYGDVTGSITGRDIQFTVVWHDNKGTAQFKGTVGDDGIARGTATGPQIPINLWNPGPWSSTDALECGAPGGQAGKTATVNTATDIFNKPDGNGTEYLNGDGIPIAKQPGKVQLVEPELCRSNWCHVVAPEVPGDAWIYIGDGMGTYP